ncbi:MAG: beta strand repeat-containing protein, partial [Verrucomicrobiota bacterium]
GSGNDTVNVGSTGTAGSLSGIAGELIVNGQGGSNILNVDDSGSAMAKVGSLNGLLLTGSDMGVDGVTYSSMAALNISLGSGNDTFNVMATNATTLTTINTGAGANTVNVASNAPAGTGGVLTGIAGKLIVNGQGMADTLNVDDSGDSLASSLILTSSTLTGLGMANNDVAKGLEFHGLEILNVLLASHDNALYLKGSPAGTITNIVTGSGANQIAIGTQAQLTPGALTNGEAPNTGSTLADVLGAINLVGSGQDTLNVDDTGSLSDKIGVLTATTLTGLGMGTGGVIYAGVISLTLSLGSGNDTLTIGSTALIPVTVNGDAGNDTFNIQATTGVTLINGGSGSDIFNLGSLTPATLGTVNAIAGALTLEGGAGSDTMNVDDSGDATANTGLLTANTLSGLGLGAVVNYAAVEMLHINLGSGNDTFNLHSTLASTTTTVSTGAGANTVNVGSDAPVAGGTLNDIQGALIVVGSGSDVLNLDDSGDTTPNAGFLIPANLTGLGMGAGITFSGLDVLNVSLGSGDDTFSINDMTDATITRIDGGAGSNTATLNFSNFAARELTLTRFESATLNVVGNFSGLLNDDGGISTAAIGGSLTSTGVLNAGTIDTMTIGVDLAGLVNVTGLLGSLTVTGATPGKVIAGDIHTITVLAGYGNKVLQVIEAGVERQIQALRLGGAPMSNLVTFTFIYDSVSADVPQLAIRVTNSSPTTERFDLVLVAHSATAKFNLAYLEAVGNSGISNVAVEGDLLGAISQPALDFLALAAGTRSGVNLPLDNLAGVAVRDTLLIGRINVAGIQGLAFANLIDERGTPVNIQKALSSTGKPVVLWNLLGSQAALLPATEAFLIPFSETQTVQLYAQVDRDLSLDLVLSFTDQIVDDASIRASVQIQPALEKKAVAAINRIDFIGDGASVDSQYAVGSITSTGALGDLSIRGKSGLGSVTAAGIFGNINVWIGSIYGTIETTGVRIDPISGVQTTVDAGIGRLITDAKGNATGVTV